MVQLLRVEIENFKSYRDSVSVGPFKNFISIVGPNGCGKSNLMDAISFVLCAKTTSLRVRRLCDLIYGGEGSDLESGSVSGVFTGEDFQVRKFTRTVKRESANYKIDDKTVSYKEYLDELKNIGIDSKRQNFLVFQGNINSVALKTPKELTVLLEELSGSYEYKEQYEQLSDAVAAVKNAMLIAINEKKVIMRQYKAVEKQVAEINTFKKMGKELAGKRLELQLFQLYYCEQAIGSLGAEREECTTELGALEERSKASEERLKALRKEAGVAGRELARIEQEAREMEVDVNKKRLRCVKTKEQESHLARKLECARRSLVQARKAEEARAGAVEEYTTELAEMERRWRDYERQAAEEHAGLDISLRESQVLEYERLKQEAVRRSSALLQQLDKLERKQKLRRDLLDNESRKKKQAQDTIKWRSQEMDKLNGRLEKLSEFILSVEEILARHRAEQARLQQLVGTSKERLVALHEELEKVMEDLGDAKSDSSETQRSRARLSTLENLKKQFYGVYGRLYEVCKPISQKYNVATTKAMGSYMDAIVVDSDVTARECVMFLKRHMSERETFLPLNSLQLKPLKSHLRNITEPGNVKLLFDVLNFSPPEVETAVWFATANVLVCQTSEDAEYVAYNMESRTHYDVVSLDGTYYKKNGLISGGQVDLARKAKRWDEKAFNELKARKETLLQEVNEARRVSRSESELNTLSILISSCEARLKSAIADKSRIVEQEKNLTKEVETLKTEVKSIEDIITALTQHMEGREAAMIDIRKSLHVVEDEVFQGFCQQVGIENIRQYEETLLRTHEKTAEKRLEFENQKSRISALLELEKSKDVSANMQRWTQAVSEGEKALLEAQQRNENHKRVYEEALAKLDALKALQSTKQAEIKTKENEIRKIRHENADIIRDKTVVQKKLIVLESKIEQQKVERRKIFKNSKVDGIALPLTEGNMDDIFHDTSLDTSTGESSRSTRPSEGFESITIDYSMLRQGLKEITNPKEIKETVNIFEKDILEREAAIAELVTPNLKAGEQQERLRSKILETNKAYKDAQVAYQETNKRFMEVQCKRRSMFMKCYEHVSKALDDIYKDITGSLAGVAMLTLEDDCDPYSGGTQLCCIVPGKSCLPLANLSGGEQTILGLALIYAFFSYNPSPLLILDEIDVALDNVSVHRIIRYLKKRSDTIQTVFISHKEELYGTAQVLLGVNPKIEDDVLCSQMLTLNLEEYPEKL
ncbi:structural maintenance of chromosomes protein 1A-like isoform X2 [Bacillus rossius redtenbacheri]|uniref:structural maintenance of chromosomes protein 1A-like isoform X2 n=1 Tax=Bacillus rossius redtenbacheri TaxID=93214 RepID=UPI002FDD812B